MTGSPFRSTIARLAVLLALASGPSLAHAQVAGALPAGSPTAPSSTIAPSNPLPAKPPASTPITQPPAAAVAPPKPLTPTFTADTSAPAPRGSVRVTKGSGVLPNDFGQVWREYDISPYTSRAEKIEHPEQAIIDWILRATGTEVWFTPPLGILNANSQTLRVYHTPEMHATIHDIVERFVAGPVEPQPLTVRLMTVGSPAWRSRAVGRLKPIEVQSPGVEGWLLSKEDAAMLLADLRRRGDFTEQGGTTLSLLNGQSDTLSRTLPREYPKTIRLRPEAWPGYELIRGRVDEGYSLQLSPLLSADGKTMELALRCNIDQVERMAPVNFDVPIAGQTTRAQIQVPQLVSWRLNERIRWPQDEVLLLSCGVVANPGPDTISPLSLIRPLEGSHRGDALLMVEAKTGTLDTLVTAPLPPAAVQGKPRASTATRNSPSPWRY